MRQRDTSVLGDTQIAVWLWLALALFWIGTILVLVWYGGLAFWPGLVGGFGATLAAFLLALNLDHEKERRRAEHDATALRDRLVVEAKRRLEPVRKELSLNQESVDSLAKAFGPGPGVGALGIILHPQLLEGAWGANAPRLSEILADYELIGNLGSTYGRIEELRWRLRQRTPLIATAPNLANALDAMTKPLIDDLVLEVADVLARVDAQIVEPTVEP